eukprot:TRINITY_DN5711_c0_g1_i12.p1 TRINITY_DN5711_c0_g1~~TRINITY_DN5711_c0_g1_i12.p1  ORF type:complete len:110 (-),score=9.81 TRINITY_DN5711_c0_g1_i12:825-1154(-)
MLVEIYFFQDLYAASLFWNGVLEKIAFLTLLLQFIICLHNDKSMLVALLSGFICILFNLIFFYNKMGVVDLFGFHGFILDHWILEVQRGRALKSEDLKSKKQCLLFTFL